MSQKLPANGFKLVKQEELSNFNGNIGYFLEVDIDYPKELLKLHEDLPFLSETKKK